MIGLWRRGWVCALALAAGLGLPLATPATARAQRKPIPFSDAAVENAIQRGKKYLWSLYRETGDPWPDVRWSIVDDGKGKKVRKPYENYGGRMSLAIYALLAAGERYTDPRMKRALEWLSRIDSKGTYTLGIRAQIWALLPREMGRELLKKDAARLIRSINQPAPAHARPGQALSLRHVQLRQRRQAVRRRGPQQHAVRHPRRVGGGQVQPRRAQVVLGTGVQALASHPEHRGRVELRHRAVHGLEGHDDGGRSRQRDCRL